MQIVACPPYEKAVQLSKARLRSGGIIAYPTDTLYGIGCDALDKNSIGRIVRIKKRDGAKPMSVIFSCWEQAAKYVDIGGGLLQKLEKLSPGPYTFLLGLKEKIPATAHDVLGCRIPENEYCRRISAEFENPIVSTSANISGLKSPSSVQEMDIRILREVDLIVDEGPTRYEEGSTIIDVINKKIVRRGAEVERAQKWLEGL